jgi:(4-O-methyl)-D-glucuronate---lignin esterase
MKNAAALWGGSSEPRAGLLTSPGVGPEGPPRPRRAATLVVILLLLVAAIAVGAPLDEGFLNPPMTARPYAYYLWLNGYVDADYMEQELEELKRAGLGGICLFDMGARGAETGRPPAGPAFLSDESVEAIARAVRKAGELGMDVDLSVSSSWDMGGSWVPPEDGSMALFHSEVAVEGPRTFDEELPWPELPAATPKHEDGKPRFHKEVAVLAIPNPQRLPGHEFVIALTPVGIQKISRVVLYNAASEAAAGGFEVAVSTTGQRASAFRTVVTGELVRRAGPQDFKFEAVEARYVRLRLLTDAERTEFVEFEAYTPDGRNAALSHHGNRSQDGAELMRYTSALGQGSTWAADNVHDGETEGAGATWASGGRPPLRIADSSKVLDLTSRVDPAGRLHWEAPEGNWTILRFVVTNTGERLKVPSPKSDGLATDHFSAGATRRYIIYLTDRLQSGIGDLSTSALKDLYLASYEVRGAVWTPDFLDQFRQRRGYDMTRYLPVTIGGTVDDEETTERFRYDFRKTLGELLVDAYYNEARETAHEAGLTIESEAGGPGPPIHMVPVDALQAQGAMDSVRGEFWPWRPDASRMWVVKETAAAAHIYGKRRVHMEAFTSMHSWEDSPQSLKGAADRAFCEGMNHVVWHTSSHQPPEAGKPGWVYHAGTQLTPNLIWWPMAKSFLSYLARTSFMLQEGNFVADVVYYYGDQGYNFVPPKHVDPSLGQGYDYDVVNAEVLLGRMSVNQGRLVLPDGMSYEVLVLPGRDDINLEVLQKIESLVRGGATVVGPRPSKATGLAGYPDKDGSIRGLAAKLWGACEVEDCENRYGDGRVITGRNLRDVLQARGMGPDLTAPAESIDFIHRRTPDAEIYFVRNKSDRVVRVDPEFRVRGRRPELWNAVSGERTLASEFEEVAGGVRVPLEIEPTGSIFVVFRRKASDVPVQPNRFDGEELLTLDGNWQLDFGSGAESAGLGTWATEEKYYSGIATYRKSFDASPSGVRQYLELGKLWAVAEVMLNGKELGVVWQPPFRVDVTSALREGRNELEIRVANTWANRLIGDSRGETERKVTRTNIVETGSVPWAKAEPIPSGLFGPVRVLQSRE